MPARSSSKNQREIKTQLAKIRGGSSHRRNKSESAAQPANLFPKKVLLATLFQRPKRSKRCWRKPKKLNQLLRLLLLQKNKLLPPMQKKLRRLKQNKKKIVRKLQRRFHLVKNKQRRAWS